MSEPAKPFACSITDCGMTFTNEDHLHVHTKKHDMVLQLGLEQKAAFVADQTPTPTRFIRNCEEVGLFQDLQNVAANPFDEGFKRAMEAKAGIPSLEATLTQTSDDVLHTPQMVFPLLDTDPALFNSQRNITISRSSSDESGTIKEFETRTISKLTNEVTTISRIVNSDDVTIKQTDIQKDVSYKNNVIRIESNFIRKDVDNSKIPVLVYTDSTKVIKDNNLVDNNKLLPEKLPIMSQKSIDFVVDSLTSELETNKSQNVEEIVDKSKINTVIYNTNKLDDQMAKLTKILRKEPITPNKKITPRILPKEVKNVDVKTENDLEIQGYEVVIKLPDGKQVRMKPVDEMDPKQVIRNRITQKLTTSPNIITTKITTPPNIVINKDTKNNVPIVNIPTGTLIPVTLVNKEGTPLTNNDLQKVPITKISKVSEITNIKLPVPIITKNKTKRTQSKFRIVNERKTVPLKSSTMFIKVSEPYQMNDKDPDKNSTKTKEILCVTEEVIKKKIDEKNMSLDNDDDDCIVVEEAPQDPESVKMQRTELERRCAASRRYRERLKNVMRKQTEENRQLREANQRLVAEKAVLKWIITEHMKGCPKASDIADRLAGNLPR